MENIKEITIYDIAKSLDVSPSTVSRALNNDPTVSKKTKKKISEAAAQMGYRSNQVARSLRQQNSLTIGVIAYELNSSIMISILSGIEKIANETGYSIIITDSGQSAEKEAINAANLFNRRVDGLIVSISPGAGTLDHFKPFTEKQIPIIFLDTLDTSEGAASVGIDNAMCGYMATRHLIEQGCTRIAHITSSIDEKSYKQRYSGYLEALGESNISADEDLLVVSPATEEAAEKAAKKILGLRPLPDGVFITDDLVAAVTMRTFLEHGVRVPQDIAVVGFNNDIIGKFLKPTLTTINYPGKEMGEAAARLLFNRLKGTGDTEQVTSVSIRADLIIRQSSLKKV